MSETDLRFNLLVSWLAQYFGQEVCISLICGDASFRRYFRLTVNKVDYIVADSPIALVPVAPFVSVAKAYQQAGLLVPQIIHVCNEHGFVLQTDVGQAQLLSVITPANVSNYYQQALDLLVPISQVTTITNVTGQQSLLPEYDSAFVERELAIFTQWLIGEHLQYEMTAAETTMLTTCFQLLVDNVEQQPKVGMHRDFHSRNLLINHDDPQQVRLAVIDFQDAVIGPVTYDAVSLLRDCYIRWPENLINPLIKYHYALAIKHQLMTADISFAQYLQWFDLMGLQRHLKAAGIFARLKLRDGKPGYMADIPLTLQYVIDIAKRYQNLTPLGEWVEKVVLPLVQQRNRLSKELTQ